MSDYVHDEKKIVDDVLRVVTNPNIRENNGKKVDLRSFIFDIKMIPPHEDPDSGCLKNNEVPLLYIRGTHPRKYEFSQPVKVEGKIEHTSMLHIWHKNKITKTQEIILINFEEESKGKRFSFAGIHQTKKWKAPNWKQNSPIFFVLDISIYSSDSGSTIGSRNFVVCRKEGAKLLDSLTFRIVGRHPIISYELSSKQDLEKRKKEKKKKKKKKRRRKKKRSMDDEDEDDDEDITSSAKIQPPPPRIRTRSRRSASRKKTKRSRRAPSSRVKTKSSGRQIQEQLYCYIGEETARSQPFRPLLPHAETIKQIKKNSETFDLLFGGFDPSNPPPHTRIGNHEVSNHPFDPMLDPNLVIPPSRFTNQPPPGEEIIDDITVLGKREREIEQTVEVQGDIFLSSVSELVHAPVLKKRKVSNGTNSHQNSNTQVIGYGY